MLFMIIYVYVWIMLVLNQIATVMICRDECSSCPCEDNFFKWMSSFKWKETCLYAVVYLLWPITMMLMSVWTIIRLRNKK